MSEQGFTVRLSARVDGYLAAMESAKRATKEVGDSGVNLDRLGGKMQDTGITLSKSVTLPLIGAAGLAIKMSSDFESAFARMSGLAGVEASEVDGLKKSVLALAGETAQSPQKLADALYEASSAGLDTAGAMEAVKVAAKGAAVGMGSAQDIVGLVASATAAYGKENISAARATDILTASIKAGRADPEELAGSLGRILPIASQLGVSFDEVGGATAFLSNIMGNTAETVTALQGFFVQLLSPTQQGKQALLDMGTSVEDLHAAIDEKGLMGALELLRSKGFAANQDALRNLFPDVQAFQGALALVSDTSGALSGTLDATRNSTGQLDKAFAIAADTGGFKMKQAWADVQVAMIKAGDVILPIAAGVADAIARIATVFSDLPGPAQKIVVAFLALVAAAGPVLMVSGTMIKNFKEIKSALEGVQVAAGSASIALAAVALVAIGAIGWYSAEAKKKQELIAITNTFTDALKAEAEGQTGATDAAIMASVSNPKLIEQARVLGLSLGDLAKIVRGETVPAYEHWQQMAHDDTWTQLGSQMNDVVYAFGTVNTALGPLNDGYTLAKESADALADAQRQATDTASETARESRKAGGAVVEQVAATDDLAASTVDVAAAAKEATAQTALFQAAADSMAADLKRNLDEIQSGWDALTGQIDDDQALTNLQGDFDNVKQKAQEAWKAASEGADDSAQKVRDSQTAVNELKKSVIDYGKEILGLPKERVTKMLAEIDAGNMDHVEAQLAALARNRNIQLEIILKGGSGNFKIVPNVASAAGRFVSGGSNVYSSLGEVPGSTGDEAVLPIGNQQALMGWLNDPRVGPPIAAAAAAGGWGPGATSSSTTNHNTVQFGDINNTVDMAAAWQQAMFALAAVA